jgi:hypothetical protein
MQVMIMDNMAISACVVNGAVGTLKDVKYEVDDQGRQYAVCAYVHVPGVNVQAPSLPSDMVPVQPIKTHFLYTQPNSVQYRISHIQLALLPAYAFTNFKIQGQSMLSAIVDPASSKLLQSIYVMLSRAVSLDSIAILRWFPNTKFNSKLPQDLRNEFAWLSALDKETEQDFNLCSRISEN